ncbi:MAG: LPXTG cell wall anchor domain-containing protein [Gaiellaceae bacterium]
MGILNRRNAVLGWAAWQMGKRMAKRKAKQAVPSIDAESKRPNKPAVLSGLAALGGALWFWRKRKGEDDSESSG